MSTNGDQHPTERQTLPEFPSDEAWEKMARCYADLCMQMHADARVVHTRLARIEAQLLLIPKRGEL